MRKKQKPKFYALDKILSVNADYNIIIGERSNGKSYACLMHSVRKYAEKKEKTALIRRWKEDMAGKRGSSVFEALCYNNEIERLTNGEWNSIFHFGQRWYMCRYGEDGKIECKDEEPFCYGFSISSMEHDKSASYPAVTTIIFDEFLTRSFYLKDEFILFMNTLSTIIRQRDKIKIFMLGNTVSKSCPYFKEMGLRHIKNMKQGTLDIYNYGDSGLKVAVEFCASNQEGKISDKYFAFDNPRLQMIKSGTWEIALYPHCPAKYRPADVMLKYYIDFDGIILECEIVVLPDSWFTFIHPKTTELQENDYDIIYSDSFSHLPNRSRFITHPRNALESKIAAMFRDDKVFYSDNETGEAVNNYLKWCAAHS